MEKTNKNISRLDALRNDAEKIAAEICNCQEMLTRCKDNNCIDDMQKYDEELKALYLKYSEKKEEIRQREKEEYENKQRKETVKA